MTMSKNWTTAENCLFVRPLHRLLPDEPGSTARAAASGRSTV